MIAKTKGQEGMTPITKSSDKPVIEGYLLKRAIKSGINWKQRYFVLYPNASLYYFTKKGAKVPKGVMQLSTEFFVGDSTLRKYAFQVSDLETTTYYLAACNAEQKMFWMHTIAGVIRRLHTEEQNVALQYADVKMLNVGELRKEEDVGTPSSAPSAGETPVQTFYSPGLLPSGPSSSSSRTDSVTVTKTPVPRDDPLSGGPSIPSASSDMQTAERRNGERDSKSTKKNNGEERSRGAFGDDEDAETKEIKMEYPLSTSFTPGSASSLDVDSNEATCGVDSSLAFCPPPPLSPSSSTISTFAAPLPPPVSPCRRPVSPSTFEEEKKKTIQKDEHLLGGADCSSTDLSPSPCPPSSFSPPLPSSCHLSPSSKKELIGPSQTAELKKLWERRAADVIKSTKTNPFSKHFDPSLAKTERRREREEWERDRSSTYGRPEKGSLSAQRAERAQMWVEEQMQKLLYIIRDRGRKPEGEGIASITFGELFYLYQDISDTLVGILLRAKKRNKVNYDGDMLFQGCHDKVVITLLSTEPNKFEGRERDREGTEERERKAYPDILH